MSDLVPATRAKILEAAMLAMGRLGPRRMTMGDVSAQARLSRGTIYRYFPTKEDLLAVLAVHEQDRFAGGLAEALAAVPDGDVRLETIASYIVGYLRDYPALTQMIDTEPGFVLSFLRQQLPVFDSITEELLAPVMRHVRPVQEGWVTASELNELLLRVVLSVLLVPGGSKADLVEVLEHALDPLVRLAAGGQLARHGPRASNMSGQHDRDGGTGPGRRRSA